MEQYNGQQISLSKDQTKNPARTLAVFISSSIRDEGDFSWSSLRRNLAEKLRGSNLFSPFAIEEHAALIPSKQYYRGNVNQCDIFVALIRKELRGGTEDEIWRAIDSHVPMMLILIGKQHDKATQNLINHIHNEDYCTTCEREDGAVEDLTSFIVNELVNNVVFLVKGKILDMNSRNTSSIEVRQMSDSLLPKETILCFGKATSLLPERFGYQNNWINDEHENSYLAPLGEAIISWIMDGKSFSVAAYKATIQLAMSEAGVPANVLDHRLNALDRYIAKDYDASYQYIVQARHLVAEDSWIYGNCLIDERNITGYISTAGLSSQIEIQNAINNSRVAVLFPLAQKYENSAIEQTLKTARKYRTLTPRSTIYDNALASVLRDLSNLAFVAVLYGSIATLSYVRVLIANALLDYAVIYHDHKLAYEGIRLLLLSGAASEFKRHLKKYSDSLSEYLKDDSDSLWDLTKLCETPLIPRMRCICITTCASYFSDRAFSEAESYLIDDQTLFITCRQEWIAAINSVKLRMKPENLTKIITQIVDNHLYDIAAKLGNIVLGCNYSSFSSDEIDRIANSIKSHSDELIKRNFSFAAFAQIASISGSDILSKEQIESARDVDAALYCGQGADRVDIELACIDDLINQYRKNNRPGVFFGFSYNPASTICRALDSDKRRSISDALKPVLSEILDSVAQYRGDLSALTGPMEVLCKYICCLRADSIAIEPQWLTKIELLDEVHPNAMDLGFSNCSYRDAWRIRLHALRIAAGIDDGLNYLVDGVSIDAMTFESKMAYVESLTWLIDSGLISSRYKTLLIKVCSALAECDNYEIRKTLARCLASCSQQWGVNEFEHLLFALARDPSDDVVYKILRICQNGELHDHEVENKLIELLSNDANWFIRWHANNSDC